MFLGREQVIQDRVMQHYQAVENLGYNVFYVGLYGSQNYNLDYEDSDIDTKCMIIPSFRDIVLNKKPVSFTHVMEDGAHCDVKDIRLMFQCFRKQNINFLEILFTEWHLVNSEYEDEMESLTDNKELIAHYDQNAFVNCCAGMAMEKYKALEHPYPTIKHKIDEFGYDGKQLHHIYRMKLFLSSYLDGMSFEDCLLKSYSDTSRDLLMRMKRNEPSLEAARKIASLEMRRIDELKQNFKTSELPAVDYTVDVLMEEILTEVFRKSFKEELTRKEDN